MRLATILIAVFLSGCSTVVPVKQKFPQVPETLMKSCPPLEKLKDEALLSDVAKSVTLNYSTYHGCAVKNDAWIEWYQLQKNIHEEANK